MAINGRDLFGRIVAGFIYIVITGVLTALCTQTAALVMGVTAGICAHEFCKMAKVHGDIPVHGVVVAAAVLIPLSLAVPIAKDGMSFTLPLTIAFVAAVIILIMFVRDQRIAATDAALSVFAYLYTGLTLCSIVVLRDMMPGILGGLSCVLILASVWFNDAFAYLGGSLFGKHKFAPKISPKKTWEGILFGMVGSMLFWLLIPVVNADCGFGFACAAISGLVCGSFCICGDLIESRFKRYFGVKDSGHIMQGHGGLLDRSDSMLVCGPIAAGMLIFFMWLSNVIGVML